MPRRFYWRPNQLATSLFSSQHQAPAANKGSVQNPIPASSIQQLCSSCVKPRICQRCPARKCSSSTGAIDMKLQMTHLENNLTSCTHPHPHTFCTHIFQRSLRMDSLLVVCHFSLIHYHYLPSSLSGMLSMGRISCPCPCPSSS